MRVIMVKRHIELHRADHASLDGAGVEMISMQVDLCELLLKVFQRQTGRYQSANGHIAAHACKTIEIEDPHRERVLVC